MKRITWLVGPPGAGKSTLARRSSQWTRTVELNEMLGPLVDPLRITKGVLQANAKLSEVVRTIEHHPDNQGLAPILIVVGLVPEVALYLLHEGEKVFLLQPEYQRWCQQLEARPSYSHGRSNYRDFEYAESWYHRLEGWSPKGYSLTKIETKWEPNLLGR